MEGERLGGRGWQDVGDAGREVDVREESSHQSTSRRHAVWPGRARHAAFWRELPDGSGRN